MMLQSRRERAVSSRRGRIAVALAWLALGGCQSMSVDAPRATAELQPTQGHATRGSVQFTQRGDKVEVHASVTGLVPNREHGFHVHEAGDCSAGDGMSAKGHFNPGIKPHGHFGSASRHVGDMPNLRPDERGRAEARFELDLLTLQPGPNNIIGRGLIGHAQPDDYASQPAGNAGARLACGVIEAR